MGRSSEAGCPAHKEVLPRLSPFLPFWVVVSVGSHPLAGFARSQAKTPDVVVIEVSASFAAADAEVEHGRGLQCA